MDQAKLEDVQIHAENPWLMIHLRTRFSMNKLPFKSFPAYTPPCLSKFSSISAQMILASEFLLACHFSPGLYFFLLLVPYIPWCSSFKRKEKENSIKKEERY